jgi:DnaK suppressor protein
MKHAAEERQLLLAKMAELQRLNRDQSALRIESAADPFDQIQASSERDLLVGLLNRDAQLRDDLRRAFDLMESGDYGKCEDCEAQIAPARLKAIPWARCCVNCQELRDKRIKEDLDTFSEAA